MIERIECHLARYSFLYLILASITYFALTGIVAANRPFWYDELFTFHIAKLDSGTEVLHALLARADIHPPLDYLVRHVSISLLGPTEFADRLPSLVAFWILCLALYRFVSFRCGPIFGLVAFLTPCLTLAYDYSYEGRPYALMLAGASLGLLGWQSVANGSRRFLDHALLCVGLFLCVAAHYYGVFVYIPVVVGEVCRVITRKKVHWLTLVAVTLSGGALALNLPFLISQLQAIGTYWTNPSLHRTTLVYWWLFNEAVYILPVALVLGAVVSIFEKSPSVSHVPPEKGLPHHEVCAAVSMLFIPFVCFLLAKYVTGAFLYRYMMLTVIGAIITGSYLLYMWLPNRAILRVAAILALGLASLFEMTRTYVEWTTTGRGPVRCDGIEAALPADLLPIVYGVRSDFMVCAFYGNAELRNRTHYLVNRQASLERIGNDNGQRAMEEIAPYISGNVVNYDAFLRDNESFLLISPWGSIDWLLPQLLADGARIEHEAVSGNDVILRVLSPKGPRNNA